MIEKIVQDMAQGNITPLEAVELINIKIGGITGVNYRKGLTIQNDKERESVDIRSLGRKEARIVDEFATLAYLQAQKNGSIRPGEVHLEKGLSSKHYAKQFREYAGGLAAKYAVA